MKKKKIEEDIEIVCIVARFKKVSFRGKNYIQADEIKGLKSELQEMISNGLIELKGGSNAND